MAASAQAAGARAVQRRRKARQDLTAWAALLAAPFAFGNTAAEGDSAETLVAPGRGRLAIGHDAGLEAGSATVTAGLRSWTCPVLAAGAVHRGNLVERGQLVHISRSAATDGGTLTLYLIDSFGRALPIGSAVFT